MSVTVYLKGHENVTVTETAPQIAKLVKDSSINGKDEFVVLTRQDGKEAAYRASAFVSLWENA